MDSEITAYLEEVRAHRGELGEAMRALDDALAMPLGLGQLWRRRVRAALTELAHDLDDHVSLTEAPGGLYADLRTRSPRLASGVEAQLADHIHFVTEVGRLNLLARHRQRGSDLIYEAYAVDIGGSD